MLMFNASKLFQYYGFIDSIMLFDTNNILNYSFARFKTTLYE